jgi:hypothetical protein
LAAADIARDELELPNLFAYRSRRDFKTSWRVCVVPGDDCMFRFTIRDVLWLTVVVGLACGWWIERRKLQSDNLQLRSELIKVGFRLVPLESFTQGVDRIYAIRDEAKKSPPSPEAAAEIIYHVRHDTDFRIRIRAMGVLPYLNERTEAIEVLREVLNERDNERSADGTVPLYAVRYLAEMKALVAIDDIKSWLEYLKRDTPYELTSFMIERTEHNLRKLTGNSDMKVAD